MSWELLAVLFWVFVVLAWVWESTGPMGVDEDGAEQDEDDEPEDEP